MSETQAIDTSNGFVMLPNDVFEQGLTPGAFFVLGVLCKYANATGHSWASLKQIGAIVGKSKAAVSGYVAELRAAGLVTTETQKTANGYNYRLRFHVTFWSEIRAKRPRSTPEKITPKRGPKPDRSVQEAERHSKEKIQKNKTHESCRFLSGALKEWARITGNAPYPALAAAPTPTLIARSRADIATASPGLISADIERALKEVWAALAVTLPAARLSEQVMLLAAKRITQGELAAVTETLRTLWQPHWRKPPSTVQFKDLTERAVPSPVALQRKLLEGYLKRWERAGKPLRNDGASGFVDVPPGLAA